MTPSQIASAPARRGLSLVLLATFACLGTRVALGQPADDAPPADDLLDERRAAIREALRSGGQYLATVLLDERGMSRGDYDLVDGQWHFYEPAWHTGQAIFGLLRAHDVLQDSTLLQGARRAGDWWVSLQIEDHPVLEGYLAAVHGDNVGELINFTTIADGTPGLFALYRETGDSVYAAVPTRAGRWAIENLYLPDEALLYDLVDVETGEIWKDRSPFFEGELTVHQVARPNNEGYLFYDMYRYTGQERYREVFLNLSEGLLERQGDDGLWMDYHPNNREENRIHPRFNIWYAESLVKAFELTGERRFLEAAARTARTVQTWQRDDGRIYYENRPDGTANESSLTGSAVAFAGILWLQLKQHGYSDEFDESIERSLDWLLTNRFAEDHSDPNLRGAFLETRTRHRDPQVLHRVRGIATSFGLRFLADYYQATNEQTTSGDTTGK